MGEVAERGNPCSEVAQRVVLHDRVERWGMHSMVGSLQEEEGGAQRTKRTPSDIAKAAADMGDSHVQSVAPLGKGEDP